jgi:hypothetical protein
LLDEVLVNEDGATQRIVYRFVGEYSFFYDDASFVDVVLVSGDSYQSWKFKRLGELLKQVRELV